MTDYRFYALSYGGKLTEAEFTVYAAKAAAYIGNLTYGRAANDTLHADSVNNAVCEIADIFADCDKHAGVHTESVDGDSVTYCSAGEVSERLLSTARIWLGDTGLMYTGL